MNLRIFLFLLAMPLLISGQSYFDLGKKLLTHRGYSAQTTTHHDLITKLAFCIYKVTDNGDYIGCLEEEAELLKGMSSPSDPKISCCSRVMNLKCMKKYLTSDCGVTREEVERNNEEHFKFWNEADVEGYPHLCSQGSEESIRYCHSGTSKVTWSLMLQFAVILACFFLFFGKL